MRRVENPQIELGQLPIDQIKINLKSRDDIPALLLGLQHIYTTPNLRERVFEILANVVPRRRQVPPASDDTTDTPIKDAKADPNNGRPGMDQWRILVLGTLRLGINADYDRLHDLANNHRTVKQMLGHSDWLSDQPYEYTLNTIKDNVRLFTPEILDQINQEVVRAGHQLLSKKKPDAVPIEIVRLDGDGNRVAPVVQTSNEALKVRCDSFVVETNVHFPTDANLLLDAVRKCVQAAAMLALLCCLCGWRQHKYLLRQLKKGYRHAARLKASTSPDEKRRQAREHERKKAYLDYVLSAQQLLVRAKQSAVEAQQMGDLSPRALRLIKDIDHYGNYALKFCDQIVRRVGRDEVIRHEEKLFSIFEPHTEWVSKGKAGVPKELGLKVCIVEDQYQFFLHHRVMVKEGDEQIAVNMIDESMERFGAIQSASFDKGFHSPANHRDLAERVEQVALPKKGKLSASDQQREQQESFVQARYQHSAVESAINALEQTGLDRCPDRGLDGFKRYVALAVLTRNLKRLGTVAREQEIERQKRRAAAILCRAA